MQNIKKIGIVGAGKMGIDIFSYLFEFDYSLAIYCHNQEEIAKVEKLVRKKFKRFEKYEFLTSTELDDKRENIFVHGDLEQLIDCDLIIESIPEKIEWKGNMLKELDQIVKNDCLFTSNSSSILPSKLKKYVSDDRQVFGLHFFYPVSIKEHVEIVLNDDFDEKTLRLLRDFILSIRKTYLIQDSDSAFILNRIFLEIQLEAFRLFQEKGCNIETIDEVAKEYFSETGIFEFMDHVGIDTMLESVRNYSSFGENKKHFQPLIDHLETMVVSNRLGNKSGGGFYEVGEELDSDIKLDTNVFDEIHHSIDKKLRSYLEFVSKMKYFDVCKLNAALKEYTGIDKDFIN